MDLHAAALAARRRAAADATTAGSLARLGFGVQGLGFRTGGRPRRARPDEIDNQIAAVATAARF
jgi:hypothetical protein